MTTPDEQKAIEEEFLTSWNYVENYYASLIRMRAIFEHLKPMLNLVVELRTQGYDRQLKAIHSMSKLMLSRSRKHGLPVKTPTLAIDQNLAGGMDIRYWEPGFTRSITVEQFVLTPELRELLEKLLKHPIES